MQGSRHFDFLFTSDIHVPEGAWELLLKKLASPDLTFNVLGLVGDTIDDHTVSSLHPFFIELKRLKEERGFTIVIVLGDHDLDPKKPWPSSDKTLTLSASHMLNIAKYLGASLTLEYKFCWSGKWCCATHGVVFDTISKEQFQVVDRGMRWHRKCLQYGGRWTARQAKYLVGKYLDGRWGKNADRGFDKAFAFAESRGYDLVIIGHFHYPRRERRGGRVVVEPGGCLDESQITGLGSDGEIYELNFTS